MKVKMKSWSFKQFNGFPPALSSISSPWHVEIDVPTFILYININGKPGKVK